jgi:hypothetical protein
MAKSLVQQYSINLLTNTVTIKGNVKPQNILVITDVNTNTILYNFAAPAAGYVSVTYDASNEVTDVVLVQNLTTLGVTATSPLLIYIDVGPQVIDVEESLLDPVNKIRVSQPQNLIDTDFEYGLQSTKWETLEMSNNIPSFYSTQSESFLYGLTKVESLEGSNTITVTFDEPHRLSQGTPIDVKGLTSQTAEGKYLIARVTNDLAFTYRAKKIQPLTAELNGPYTTIVPGQFYSGSGIDFTTIETDSALESTLTITTPHEHGFQPGSQFYLTNTISPVSISITQPTTNLALDGRPVVDFTNLLPISGIIDSTLTETKYFRGGYANKINASNVDLANSRILWDGHLLKNADCLLYVPSSGDQQIGGLNRLDIYYLINTVPGVSFQLTASAGGTPISFTSAGTYSFGRAQLMLVYEIRSANKPTQSQNVVLNPAYVALGTGSGWDLADPTYRANGESYGLTGSKADVYATLARSTNLNIQSSNIQAYGPQSYATWINETSNTPSFTNPIEYGQQIQSSFGQQVYWPGTQMVLTNPGTLTYQNGSWDFWGSYSSSYSANDIFVLPLFQDEEANTLYSSGSNLANNSDIDLNTETGQNIVAELGTSWASINYFTLVDGVYQVEAVSLDRFRLKYNGTPVNIYSAQGQYDYDGEQTNLAGNTFFVQNHGLTTNELVKITTNSGGVLPTTSTGVPPLVPAVDAGVLYNVIKLSIDEWKTTPNGTGFIDLVLDGFNEAQPMQYGSGTGWSGSAFYNMGLNQYVYDQNAGANYFPNWTSQALDTGASEDLLKGTSGAGRGYYVAMTPFSQNATVSSWIQVLIGPNDGQYIFYNDMYVNYMSSTFFSLSQDTDVNLGNGWFARSNISYNNGSQSNTNSVVWMRLAMWYDDWDPATANFYNFQSSWGGQMYNNTGTTDFYYANIMVQANNTVNMNDTIVASLRTQLYDDMIASFIFPTITQGGESRVTIVNNNRFRLNDPISGKLVDLTSSGAANIKFELVSQTFGSLDGAYAITSVPTETSMTIQLPFQTENKQVSFDTFEDVDPSANLIFVPQHNFAPGARVTYSNEGTSNIQNLVNGTSYYANVEDDDYIGLATTFTNAISGAIIDINTLETPIPGEGYTHSLTAQTVSGLVKGAGLVQLTAGSTVITGNIDTLFKRYFKPGDVIYFKNNIATPGELYKSTVRAITDDALMVLDTPMPVTVSATNYFISSSVTVRPDGSTQHRPFDGGVEISAGSAPDTQIIRQTRKYFRYQSGKGIQTSLAINFNVPIQFESLAGSEGTYTEVKCERDLGYIVDGVQYDIALGTNYNARFLGIAETNSLDISPVVITAIQNTNEAIVALPTVAGDAPSVEAVNDFYDELLKIVNFGRLTASELTFTNPTNASVASIAAKDKLLANLVFIEDEINAWVDVTYPANNHDVAKCTRDVKYAVHGFCYDILYGGNSATYDGAKFFLYFDTDGNNGIIPEHIIQTVAAYGRLKAIITDIVQGVAITKSAGNTSTQVTSGANATSTEGTILQDLAQIIADTIENSEVPAVSRTLPSITWAAAGLQASSAAIASAKTTIVTDSVPDITTAFGKTKYPHGLNTGNQITVEGASDPAYNGRFPVGQIVDEFTFSYSLASAPTQSIPGGLPTFNISTWTNSFIRAGMFDDQNGFFYEYDGQEVHCVRRSSTQQLPGTASTVYNSNVITGLNTNWTGQLVVGDKIVVRGMTYRVVKIRSRTEIVVQPKYRGASSSGVIVTKTEDTRVPQSQWSLDKCDGSGYTGYILDETKIQMAYMDYSWYGAGKLRFGFKTSVGRVNYVHEFVHNNRLTEAYMRSGNLPARYEIENKTPATYIPTLFHWGTSVIMDGRFDDDKAYLFTANSNTLIFTNGQNTTSTTNAASALTSEYNFNKRNFDWYVTLSFPSEDAFKFTSGTPLYSNSSGGGGYGGSAPTVNLDGEIVDSGYYSYNSGTGQFVFVVRIYVTTSFNTPAAGQYPNIPSGTEVGIGAPITGSGDTGTVLRGLIPLISIRLAPSVDNSLTGNLGERDIINRMQMQLQELGLVTTHDCEISLILNGSPSSFEYEKVENPSLSNLIRHRSGDTISNGTIIFQLRASGGSTTTNTVVIGGQPTQVSKRLSNTDNFDLSKITDLGNSILGGDGIFPNGPDLLTVAVKVINVSEISAQSPFNVSGRITWTESQA